MAKKKKSEKASSGGGGVARAMGFMVIATVMGAMSILGLNVMINGYKAKIAEAKKPEDTVMVIVAARDLYQGVTISEEDLYMVDIPPRFLPENVFLSPEHVVGRVPRERILANEFIRGDRLADPESGAGLNAVIPRGMRAISIDISDGRALTSFLQPTNYVDIIVTIKPDKESEKQLTKTILQAVFVLGVDSRQGSETMEDARNKRGKHKPSVTLLVTADDAETVANAYALGEITLALRNDLDIAHAETQGVDVDALRRKLEVKKPVRTRRAAAPKDNGGELIIIKGDKKETRQTSSSGEIK